MPHTSPVLPLPETHAHVLSAPDGSTVLRLSSGRFLRVQAPPPGLLPALADDAQGTHETAEYVQVLRDTITTRETADAETRWPSQRRVVGLTGEAKVMDDVAHALQEWGVEPRRFATAHQLLEDRQRRLQSAGTDFSLVISYADAPRDRVDWQRLDELPTSGCAWLRAYREGQICFIDPLSINGEDPNSEQVRRRRLAATPTPGLFTTWHDAVAPAEPLTTAAQVLVSARLLTTALAWAQTEQTLGRLRSTLWKLVPATGQISEHTVIGYDAPYAPAEVVDHP